MRGKYEALQWLMFQMGGVGPMFGQAHHFMRAKKDEIPYGSERYGNEAKRLYGVMDRHLAEQQVLRSRVLHRRHGDLSVGRPPRVAPRGPGGVPEREALVRRRGRAPGSGQRDGGAAGVRFFLLLIFFVPAVAAGMEQVSIPSLDGKLQLPGYLFEAVTPGPRPAVISLHGCGGLLDAKGGLSRNRYRVAEYLNVEGMHMLAVDSFTPRGLKSICETPPRQRTFNYEQRREDVFAAIRWLAQRPDVDRNRIAIVGYSNGGSTVLSALDRTEKLVQGQPIQPKAAVAYYPSCRDFAEMWSYEIAAPLLLMIGALDDWTSPHYCERLHDKVKRAQPGASFEVILYPGSHHGFDGYGPIQVRGGLPTKSGAATVGANPEAREKSLRRMFEFLVREARAAARAHARSSG